MREPVLPGDIIEQWHAHEVGLEASVFKTKALEMMKSLGARSEGTRAIAALLCEASPKLTGRAVPGTNLKALRSVTAGRAEFKHVEDEGALSVLAPIIRARGPDQTMGGAVKFMICPDNAQCYSWASKKVRCDGAVHQVAAVSRLKSVGTMYYDYARTPLHLLEGSPTRRIKRTSFYTIAKAIMYGEADQELCCG